MAADPTCALAAAGILVLYGDGIAHFGLFHMIDYVFYRDDPRVWPSGHGRPHPVVAILATVCLRGASPLPGLLAAVTPAGVPHPAAVACVYVLSWAGFFALYYGLHLAEYG